MGRWIKKLPSCFLLPGKFWAYAYVCICMHGAHIPYPHTPNKQAVGVIVSVGGQIANNLANPLFQQVCAS